jgi:hypothetical protein
MISAQTPCLKSLQSTTTLSITPYNAYCSTEVRKDSSNGQSEVLGFLVFPQFLLGFLLSNEQLGSVGCEKLKNYQKTLDMNHV